jgi:hypothetical protein
MELFIINGDVQYYRGPIKMEINLFLEELGKLRRFIAEEKAQRESSGFASNYQLESDGTGHRSA